MNNLQVFDFNNQEIRTFLIEGTPYFIGKDVATILGYLDSFGALKKHVDDEDKLICQIDSSGQKRDVTAINESGMFSLVLSSKMPQAKVFKRWVTSEVLPSIRKTGGYRLPGTYKEALQELLMQIEEKEKLQLENKEMKPKAEYFNALVDRNLLTNIRDTAKELHIKQSDFVAFLLDKYVYRDTKGKLKPYGQFTNSGLFEMKEFAKNNYSDVQMLITPKGRETFRLLIA